MTATLIEQSRRARQDSDPIIAKLDRLEARLETIERGMAKRRRDA